MILSGLFTENVPELSKTVAYGLKWANLFHTYIVDISGAEEIIKHIKR